MHLPRHTIESHAPAPLFTHVSFSSPSDFSFDPPTPNHSQDSSHALAQPAVFSCATFNGFLVSQSDPLKLVAKRSWSSSEGGLSRCVPLQHTSLLVLVGGGRVPRFAPNKVVLWDEAAAFTPNLRPGTRNHDPAANDSVNFSDTTHSPHASTIFSAGSQFDFYGRATQHTSAQPPDAPAIGRDVGDEDWDTKSFPSRSASPTSSSNSGQISPEEPLDQDIVSEQASHLEGQPKEQVQHLERSIAASSIGMGRMERATQAHHLTSESSASISGSLQPGLTESFLGENSLEADLASSSLSISASSADLDDPFTADEAATSSPSTHAQSFAHESASESSDSASIEDFQSARFDDNGTSRISPTSSISRPRLSRIPPTSTSSPQSPGSGATSDRTQSTKRPLPPTTKGREVAELEFGEQVRGVCVTSVPIPNPDRSQDITKSPFKTLPVCSFILVVLLSTKAIVFELTTTSADRPPGSDATGWNLRKHASVQTYKNPKGLGAVAPIIDASTGSAGKRSRAAIVALPGRQKGHVQLLRIKVQTQPPSLPSREPGYAMPASNAVGATSIIVAHESSIAAISLSPNGKLLATASTKGTLIRVWSNNLSTARSEGSSAHGGRNGQPGRTGFGATLVRELRRGTDQASIFSIAFAPDASVIAAASDKGTIHIFDLCDLVDGTSFPSHSRSSSSGSAPATTGSPSAASRAAAFGSAAARYLPSGLTSLAGQIPPSVLPQYFKSEWSSAQFRIPLKTFGAASRLHQQRSPGSTFRSDGRTSSAASLGTEKSTEGAWAQMRSRISDIRKGEAGLDESIFLCWIVEPTASEHVGTSANTDRGASSQRRGSMSAYGEKAAVNASIGPSHTTSSKSRYRDRLRLIALTTSGGWYKLCVTSNSKLASREPESISGSTVLDMYRQESSSTTDTREPKKGTASDKDKIADGCRLIDYRPILSTLDGWHI